MKRVIGTSVAFMLTLGLLLFGSLATVAAQAQCVLEVEPESARAGSQFTLRGEGYTPDRLILQRESDEPVEFELDLGAADPFEIPISSETGREGVWRATAIVDGTDCRAEVEFTVTLPSTDVVDELLAVPASGGLPLVVYLVVVVIGFGAGTLMGRYVRSAA